MADPLPPAPKASDAATRKAMQGNRSVDTVPEIRLRRTLHAAGLRFRKDRVIQVDGTRTKADIVFGPRKVAVFVDGCFWHGCATHCRIPTRNREYWLAKIGRNRDRDVRVTAALAAAGWRVVRVWEHEPVDEAAARVQRALAKS